MRRRCAPVFRSAERRPRFLDRLLGYAGVGIRGSYIARPSSRTELIKEKIAKQPTRLDRWLGRGLERQVRYRAARQTLDQLLLDAEGNAQGVRDSIQLLNRMIASHEAEAAQIKTLIQAGREYLDENPEAGLPLAGEIAFDKPRERFARKLANLATLLASHELSVNQMKLTRAQATDMLDRFQETVSVLVPVWRQHTLTLISTKTMNQALVAEATQAHQALMSSLAQSLEGIRHN